MKIALQLFLFIALCLGGIHTVQSQDQAPLNCGADKVLQGDSATRKLLAQFNQSYHIHSLNKAALDLTTVYTIPVVVHVYHLGEAVGVGSNVSTASVQAAINALNQTFRAQGNFSASQDVKIQFVLASRTPDCQATNGIVRVDTRSVSGYQANGCSSSDYATQANLRTLSSWPTGSYINIRIVHKMPDAAGFTWFLDDLFIPAQYTNGNYPTLWGHEMGHSFNLYHTFEGDNGNTQCPVNNNPDTDGDRISDTHPHKQGDNCSTYPASSTNICTGLPFGSLLQNMMSYSGCLNRFTPKQVERMRYALQYYRPGLINSFGKVPPVAGELAPTVACVVSAPNGTSPYFGIESFTFNTISVGGGGPTSENGANYADRTCLVQTNVQTGIPYSFSLTSLYGNALGAKIYIDYNNNGNFTDANEQVFSSSGYSSSFAGTISIPTGTTTNTKLRMRVMLDPTLSLNSCSLPGFSPFGSGMAEDYAITVTSTTTTCAAAVATLSGSQTSTPGQSVSLSVSLTGTSPWSLTLSTGQLFSNITTSPFIIPVAPTTATTYTISRVSNSCGVGTANGSAIITPCTAAAATLTGSQTSTPGQSVSLSVALTGTNPWSLTLNTGQVFSNVSASPFVFTVAPTIATTYSISRVSNSCGIGTASGSAVVTPCTAAVATLTGSQTSTPGQSVSLTATLTGTSPWSLTLNTGQVFTNISTSPFVFTVAPTIVSTYIISRVSNSCGIGSANGSATITPCSAAVATLSGSQTNTPGQSVLLTVTLTGSSPWSMTLNTGQTFTNITASPFSFSVTPSVSTTYAISKVSNSCGIGTANGTAVVTPCTATVATLTGSQTSTPGQSVSLNVSFTGSSPWSLTLNTGQVFANISASPFIIAVAPTTVTTYTISRVNNSCGTGTVNGSATITPCSAAVATLSGSQTSTPGQSVSLTTSLAGSSPWNLTLSTGQIFSNITASPFVITVSPTTATTYAISKVSNACGIGATNGTAVITPCTPALATLSGSQTSTPGQSVSLTATLIGTSPWSLTLSTGQIFGNITASPFVITVAPTGATTYTISRISNSCGIGSASGSATITPCTPAVATITGSQTNTPGQSVSLSVAITGTNPWSLTLNTGQVFTNISTSPFVFTVAPTISSTYTISRVSNSCGNGTTSGSAAVTPCTAAVATLTGSQTSTPGQAVSLSVALIGNSPWSLTLNSGQVFTNIISSPFVITVAPTTATTYTISQVSNVCSTGTASGTAVVTPCTPAMATLTGSQTSTPGQSVSLTAALTGTSPWSLTLNTGQVFSNISASPFVFTVTPTISTTYTIARVSNACGNGTVSGSAIVTPCTAAAATISGSQTITPGQSVSLSVFLAGTSPWSLTLNTGQVFSNIAESPFSFTVAPTLSTTYSISRISNSCGNGVANGSAVVTPITPCTPVVATLSGSQAINLGQTATLTVTLTGTSPWNLTLSTGQVFTNITVSPFSLTVAPTATTRYTVDRVSNACSNGSTSGAATILVSTPCIAATATLSGSQTSIAGQSVSLSVTLTGTSPWNLTLNTGQIFSSITTSPFMFTVAPTIATTYTIAKVSNSCGTGTASGSAVVIPCSQAVATLTGSQTNTPGQAVSLLVSLTGTSPWNITLNTGQVFADIATSPFAFTVSPTVTTSYTIGRVSNSCGIGTVNGSATVTPCTAAVATLTGSQTSTPGQSVLLSVNLTGSNPWSLTLNTGQVFSNITTTPFNFTVASTTSTTYSLMQVSNSCGIGTANGSAVVTVVIPCTLATATLTGSQTNTPGQAVSLSVALSGTSPWNLVTSTGQFFFNINTPTFVFVVSPTTSTTYTLSRVSNSCGTGQVSGSASVTTVIPCTTPTSLTETTLTANSVSLNWLLVGGKQYTVQWRLSSTTLWTSITGLTGNYSLTGLTAGTDYQWQVGMSCSDASTNYSAPRTFVTACSLPTLASVSYTSDQTAAIYWQPILPGTRYQFEYRQQGSLAAPVSVTTLGSQFLINGLSPGTAYEYRIRTVCTEAVVSAFTSYIPFNTQQPCTAMFTIGAGSWTDYTRWSCNRVPTRSDITEIRHRITIPAYNTAESQRLRYTNAGTLITETGAKIRLGF